MDSQQQLSKQTILLWAVVAAFAVLGYFAAKEWAKLKHDVDQLKTQRGGNSVSPPPVVKAIPLRKFPLKMEPVRENLAPPPSLADRNTIRPISVPPKIPEEPSAEETASAGEEKQEELLKE